MKTVSMSGSLRENVGKKDAKKQRKQGKVPCVLYGGEQQIHFSLEGIDFNKILFTPESFIIKLSIDGKEYESILQDIQYHPVSDRVLHADFFEVKEGLAFVSSIPVTFTGSAVGVLKGGRLVKIMRKIKAKGLKGDFPEKLVLDVTKLEIGSVIKISDVSIDKLELLDPHSSVIVAVKTTRSAGMLDEEEEGEGEGEEGESTESAEE